MTPRSALDDGKAGGTPGYRDIAARLISDIQADRWPLGAQLPTEQDLTARFGVSRHTIRESLRDLDQQGYIRRRRGTRSILVSARSTDDFVNSVKSIDELLQYSSRTLSRLISVDLVVATGALAERLGVPAGSRWLRAQLLRVPSADALTIGFSEIYVAERYADIADRLTESCPVYQLIEHGYGIRFDRVEQMVEAVGASVDVAGLLQVEIGSPLLAVRTEFMTRDGEKAEIGFGHFPAERYRLEIMLERGASGRMPDHVREEMR